MTQDTENLLHNASRGTVVDVELAEKLNVKGSKQLQLPKCSEHKIAFESVPLLLQAAESTASDPILEVSKGLVRKLDTNERIIPSDADLINPDFQLFSLRINE